MVQPFERQAEAQRARSSIPLFSASSAAQEHFIDLCNLFDHPTPAAADPTGESFGFKEGAAKHEGGDQGNVAGLIFNDG